MINTLLQVRRVRWITALACASTVVVTSASDWPEWRGPLRDGHSLETGLPVSWSPKGENLAWRVPLGSRSSPVVFRNRVYLLHAYGDLANT
jgi:outer membrane protein assembly factor BamB